MEGVYLCDVPTCGNSAISFGLKGNLKVRSCKNHIASLFEKQMQVFEIAGYNFISTPLEGAEFAERKETVERGCCKLPVLYSKCDSELESALQAIESAKVNVLKSVENRFGEMQVAATAIRAEAKRQLSLLEAELQGFLRSKESQLSPAAQCVCSDAAVLPGLVRFGIADVSDAVSAVLSDSWTVATPELQCLDVSDMNAAIEVALAEAAHHAQKGIPEALKLADLLAGDDCSIDKEKYRITSVILKSEMEKTEKNWKWLQRIWNLRQQCVFSEEATIEVGKKRAILLYRQHGQFSEAEDLLRYCYEIEQKRNPFSEESMSLCNTICGLYFDSAQYEKAEQLGLWVLSTFETAHFPAECYWTTLLYLTYSQRIQAKNSEASEVLEAWVKRDLQGESRLAEMLRLFTGGIGEHWDNDKGEAEEWMLRAKRIGTSHFPTSPFTALIFSHLAVLSEGKTRELYHQHAQSIFEVSAPKTIHAAINLHEYGLFFFEMKQLPGAGICFLQAQSIYKIAGPKTIRAARNLDDLGNLCLCVERWSEAEEYFKHAQSILEDIAPKSVEAANNFYGKGSLFEARGQTAQAIEHYEKAALIFAENCKAESKSKADEKANRLRPYECVIN